MNEKQVEEQLLKKLHEFDKLFKEANPNPKKLEADKDGNLILDLNDPSDRRWYEG
ncbi:hypothetical protein MKX54_20195 [Alkalihalobacillus sp. FSL R5-0424]